MIEKIEKYMEQLDKTLNCLVILMDNLPEELQEETQTLIQKLSKEQKQVTTFYKQGRKLI